MPAPEPILSLIERFFISSSGVHFWETKKLPDARLEQERTMLSRQIEATDGTNDKLVYELYGLTAEEICDC